MRIGYLIDTYSPLGDREAVASSMDAMIEEAQLAERAGFHSVVVPDRHRAPECRYAGPEQLLTLLARETDRVAIGSYTFVATLSHPMRSAEQFSVIDNLSRGRLFTTVSRGFLPDFWGQFGIPQERCSADSWRDCGSGGGILRRAFQLPGRPLAGAAGTAGATALSAGRLAGVGRGKCGPAAARRSADYGECWTSDPLPMTDADWRARSGAYRERAHELGKQPFIVAMRDGWVADSFEEAPAQFGSHFIRSARFYVRHGLLQHPDFPSEADVTAASLAPYLVLGTAEQCIERLQAAEEERGIDYVILCCRVSTGPSFERTREQILRLGAEVVAPIHARGPAPDHPAMPSACRAGACRAGASPP